jgi:hypothetical protein
MKARMNLALVCSVVLSAAPSEAELTQLGQTIAADFAAGRDGLSSRMDVSALIDRALSGISTPEDIREGLLKGATSGFAKSWAALAAEIAEGGSLVYKRNVVLAGAPAIQMRIAHKAGDLDFIEFVVVKTPKGELRIVDFYDFAIGSLRSEEARSVLVAQLAELEKGPVDRLFSKPDPLARNAAAVRTMSTATGQNQFAEVKAAWDALPKDAQDHPWFLKRFVMAAANGDDALYQQAMTRFLTLYARDPAAQMMGIDFHYLRKEWNACLKSIAAVEQRAGPDATIDVLRGSVMLEAGRPREARSAFQAATLKEPTRRDAHLILFSLALKDRNWAELRKVMDDGEKAAGIKFRPQAEELREFVASKDGKEWLKAHEPH